MRIESRGPVFRRSPCWGRGARLFERLCLRTNDCEGRMTRTGALLRRLGIDGLPQLVNVLRGEMSLVGPAPVAAEQGAGANLSHLRRFKVRPGMTGTWALGWWRSETSGQYFSPDEAYYLSRNLWLDLAMIGRALGAIASGRR